MSNYNVPYMRLKVKIATALHIRSLHLGFNEITDETGNIVGKLSILNVWIADARFHQGFAGVVVVKTDTGHKAALMLPQSGQNPQFWIGEAEPEVIDMLNWNDPVASQLNNLDMFPSDITVRLSEDRGYHFSMEVSSDKLMGSFHVFGPTSNASLSGLWLALLKATQYIASQYQTDEMQLFAKEIKEYWFF